VPKSTNKTAPENAQPPDLVMP